MSVASWSLDNLTLFDELFVFGATLYHLECALFLDDFRGTAREIALSADSPDQARALHAAAEFANGRKRAFVAAFRYFCVDGHERRVYHYFP